MPRIFRVIAGLVVALVVLALPLAAQSGAIRGDVRDTSGTLLSGVVVQVVGSTLRSTSNGRGHYEIRGVPAGNYTLHARLIGFTPMAIMISLILLPAALMAFVTTCVPVGFATGVSLYSGADEPPDRIDPGLVVAIASGLVLGIALSYLLGRKFWPRKRP